MVQNVNFTHVLVDPNQTPSVSNLLCVQLLFVACSRVVSLIQCIFSALFHYNTRCETQVFVLSVFSQHIPIVGGVDTAYKSL